MYPAQISIMQSFKGDMRAYCAYTKRLYETQRFPELVWAPGDRVISLIYWKMKEESVIFTGAPGSLSFLLC